MATLMNAQTKQAIIATAAAAHAQYPQYAGYWDGPEWIVVVLRKRVRTKAGVAFEKGDVTIARADRGGDSRFITAYSLRTSFNTSIPIAAVVAD